eukprot:CAMPEP_0114644762 /NCGR_PEP_ID=MMETSP0191-20121206/4152_1 /TAXON_ID=126664 /ORGANISM="Sorites sp." /LENGTH=135 /DNA_ID=CAMNT_0001857269 /DNA_START=247 /DNA_END=653 /DNA_ORIENTATION=+
MMANKKPANIPAKCPTKSTFGEIVDIMMQLVHMKANQRKILDRLSPSRSQVKSTSAALPPHGDQVTQEAAEHVEQAELPTTKLFLHAEADSHLEEEVEENMSALACNIMGSIKRHTAPCAMAGPHEAPSRYNEQS